MMSEAPMMSQLLLLHTSHTWTSLARLSVKPVFRPSGGRPTRPYSTVRGGDVSTSRLVITARKRRHYRGRARTKDAS